MIFKDILDKKTQELYPVFNQLLSLCENNQTHPGDLLLVRENGFYHPEVHTWDNKEEKLSPYVMGPGSEGHSDQTHYDFIGRYIKENLNLQPSDEYKNIVKYDPDRLNQIRELEDNEGYSIQQEMLIYLKIWESDAFIKSFYQLARLANGDVYDWHFKIKESPNDNTATGNRSEIIRNTRDKFKEILWGLFNSFQTAYKTQVRNAIAHSQYIALGRYISLNNYDRDSKYNNLPSVSYNDWMNIFHETIVLYTQYNRILNAIGEHYHHIAALNNNSFEVRINREDPITTTEYRNIAYDPIFSIWH